MKSILIGLFAGVAGSGLVQPSFGAATETVLHSFGYGNDGSTPRAGVVLDSVGNLYGTTYYGGVNAEGAVYEIGPDGLESILYAFDSVHGRYPTGELFLDRKNNLYGTTALGGDTTDCNGGCGVVFSLEPNGSEAVVYEFTSNGDGVDPEGGIIKDHGALYGTTCAGGFVNGGIAYSLTKTGSETILSSFGSDPGNCPEASLVSDSAGNFYGTTYSGGNGNYGTVFRIKPDGSVIVLHSFTSGADGGNSRAALLLDGAGNLYGTTQVGGQYGYGTVFKLAADGTETILHDFTGGQDGGTPNGGLLSDRRGDLYGTAFFGGTCVGCYNGTVFKISSRGNFRVLYTFQNGSDGACPIGGLARDKSGNLYGATYYGGTYGHGTVFEISP